MLRFNKLFARPSKRLGQGGFIHHVAPLLVIGTIAVVGTYVYVKGHADTLASMTLQANATSSTESAFTWSTPAASGVTKYKVFRNGTAVSTTNDQYTTNSVDGGLTPNTAYTYQIKALNAAGTVVATSNQLPVQTAATTTPITGCNFDTTTLGSGNYVLNADIAADVPSPTGPCLHFANASNVTLDCQGHTISNAYFETTEKPIFDFDTVSHFLLVNCSSTGFPDPVDVENGSYGSIAQNTFTGPSFSFNAGGGFYLGSSTNIVVKRNTMTNVVYTASFAGGQTMRTQPLSNNNYFGFNTVDDSAYQAGVPAPNFYLVYIDGGNNNVVDNNILKGDSPGPVPCYCAGSDDGVILDNNSAGVPRDNGNPLPDSIETGDIVVNNTITNTYDTGIETVGLIQNTLIANNNVSGGEQAAVVGAFYSTSWKNVQVLHNTAGDLTEYLFYFDEQVESGGGFVLPLGQTKYYFQNNTFSDNVYAQQTKNPLTAQTSYILFQDNVPGGDPPIVTQNDTFTNNNFGTQNLTPTWFPKGMIVDGGGNICQLPKKTPATYPLKCASGTSPTAGTNSTSNVEPAVRHPHLPLR